MGSNFTATERKQRPLATGVLDYFPDALLEVALVSWTGNEQHNPGTPTHWDRAKSGDEADALMRHLVKRGSLDTDGMRHSAKVAWRALALLQKELEAEYSKVPPRPITHPATPNLDSDSTKSLSKEVPLDMAPKAYRTSNLQDTTPHSQKPSPSNS